MAAGNYKADALRTWDLQGSVDCQNWTVLKRHTNDKSLNSNFASHTWPLPGINKVYDIPRFVLLFIEGTWYGISRKQAYRYFRILQTGRNSNNHNFLVISGLELYGILYDTNTMGDNNRVD
jgi:hypothetical protein